MNAATYSRPCFIVPVLYVVIESFVEHQRPQKAVSKSRPWSHPNEALRTSHSGSGASYKLRGQTNYHRPTVPVPPQYRGAVQPGTAASLADTKWFDLFQDAALKQLVKTALERNFDLRMAAERVLEARAQYGIVHANQFPFVDAQAQFTTTRGSSVGSFRFLPRGTNLDVSYTTAGAAVSWELDLWGRRRLSESARAQYLATEEARRGVDFSRR